jgi:hypothetical protein
VSIEGRDTGATFALPDEPMSVPGHGVVGVGEVQAGGGDVIELLARVRDGIGHVDDVEDFGAAEADDLRGSHGLSAGPGP